MKTHLPASHVCSRSMCAAGHRTGSRTGRNQCAVESPRPWVEAFPLALCRRGDAEVGEDGEDFSRDHWHGRRKIPPGLDPIKYLTIDSSYPLFVGVGKIFRILKSLKAICAYDTGHPVSSSRHFSSSCSTKDLAMAKAIEDPTLLAYAGILLWSQGSVKLNAEPWPDWQRCALRRIVLGGELQAADLDELEWICKAGAGLVPTDGRKVNKAMPLDGKHLPTGTGGAAAVSLVRISGLKGVNRIKGDPPLEFGPSPGLTIIFGANGAGKSGYARVIKKACRARGNIQAIRPNVFDATDQGPAQAKITCTVGAVNTPLQWRDGTPADPRLSNVFVFDSVSARFHVSSDGPATFIPRGLNVLPKLAQACDEIKRRINEDINNENNAILTAKSSLKYTPGTKVAQLIDGLSASTKSETIEALAVLSEAEEERLAELNNALKSDPCQKSARTQAAATRIRGFKTLVTEILRGAGATKAEAIRTALNEAKTAAAAAKAAATPFAKAFLPGTGGEEWRSLWEIARSYSAVAYPGKTFPNVGDDAHCPLCQQEFDHDAVERMKQFDEYVKGEARARARKADGRSCGIGGRIEGCFGPWVGIQQGQC